MNNNMNEILEKIATELDMPDSVYEQVVKRYRAVGTWLEREASIVAKYEPSIYPQGSIQLGTVVKPVPDEDQYDLDLVCELAKLNKDGTTQHRLKDLIGTEIKGYATANLMNSRPEEGRRCWTLDYADTSKFHMDILPAIPDGTDFSGMLKARGLSNFWAAQAIAITDIKSPTYNQYSQDWPQSNPKGYASWFQSRMPKSMFKAMESRVEPVAYFREKRPLQQAIQILKRHRDIMFDGASEDKPISIIITTLAAHAYNGELTLSQALLRIVNGMEAFIGIRNGEAYIPNPANPMENFADKWCEHPQREKNFRSWLTQAKQDFNAVLAHQDLVGFIEALIPILGERAVNHASAEILEKSEVKSFDLQKATQLPPQFFNVAHRQRPRWPETIRGSVSIECIKSRKGFQPKLVKSGAPIPKYQSLSFKAKTNISHPYQVFWQVVNTGEEARLANKLRGDFYDGTKFKRARQWEESTLYKGNHWVECFIIQDGLVVARSGTFIVNIE